LAWFFALAFGISWGGILVIVAARGFDLSPLQPVEGGLIFLMMLLGPSLSGLICTALTDGRAGLQWPLLAVGFVAGSFEEIGWTGFASTRLLERHGLGQAGLTLGLVWAFWHLLADVR
jgi:membrane protease YdiL (CAAX protease family)